MVRWAVEDGLVRRAAGARVKTARASGVSFIRRGLIEVELGLGRTPSADAAYETDLAHGDLAAGTSGLDADCRPSLCPCFSAADIDPALVEGWLGCVDESAGTWDLSLLDAAYNPLGFTTRAEDHRRHCGLHLRGAPLQEGLTRAQGVDYKAIILEYDESALEW